MTLRTVRIDPCWTLERVGSLARLTCDVAVVLDADDHRGYELRMALDEAFWRRRQRMAAAARKAVSERMKK